MFRLCNQNPVHPSPMVPWQYVGLIWFQPSSVARKMTFSFVNFGCQFGFLGLGQLTSLSSTFSFGKLRHGQDMVFIPTTSWKRIISCCNGNGLINHGLMNISTILLIWCDFHHLCFRYQLPASPFGEYRRRAWVVRHCNLFNRRCFKSLELQLVCWIQWAKQGQQGVELAFGFLSSATVLSPNYWHNQSTSCLT